MKRYNYHLVDVFTNQKFTGNQLAVFPDGKELTTNQMQSIAQEFNLSETTFVFPPENDSSDFRLRIFTPGAELPMAGHPTIGTAYILAHENMIELTEDKVTTVFEENVGNIPVEINIEKDRPSTIWMNQLLPEFDNEFKDRELIAKFLCLEASDLLSNYPIQFVSCGVPFFVIPIASLAAIQKAKMRFDVLDNELAEVIDANFLLFTMKTINSDSTCHCRMFAPDIGIFEDPATGSANGPLGCYLVKHKLAKGNQELITEQGFEMKRPSILHAIISGDENNITGVKVGGETVYIGSGFIEI